MAIEIANAILATLAFTDLQNVAVWAHEDDSWPNWELCIDICKVIIDEAAVEEWTPALNMHEQLSRES